MEVVAVVGTAALNATIGKVVQELLSVVIEFKDRVAEFRPTLEILETTLRSIGPTVKQIDDLNRQLDHPPEETQELIDNMEAGKELVLKCSQVHRLNLIAKANHQKELKKLYESICTYFKLNMQAQIWRTELEILVRVNEIREGINSMGLRSRELKDVCSPPEPPSVTFGLDDPLRDLKFEFMREQISVSVLTVTGAGGLGKSTLAKKLCWDDEVRGKFKENIFFVTFGKTPYLRTIVQSLFEHNNYKLPEFQSDEDAIHQLEHLLKEIGKSPILLVLDDVWPKTVFLVDKFVFQIPNYKILVTSRFAIARFGPPYVLKRLDEADAIDLLRFKASLNSSNYHIPDKVVKEIVRGCRGSPLALRVIGRSLGDQQQLAVWITMANNLSKGHSILDPDYSDNELINCLQNSLVDLDHKVTECFIDLSLFPKAQRIPAAALVDIWALRGEDDASATAKIHELVNRSMADLIVTRNVQDGTIGYNYHNVKQDGLLWDLAIVQSSQEPTEKRKRLIINISGNNLPSWWSVQNEYPIAARILSISTDERFTSEWCNLQSPEVEVLVLNLRQKKCTLPMFMKNMNKLKVLIVTNYDFYHADLENFEMLDYLSDLKRIRLEKVSIPFLSKTGSQLKNLQKLSFFMCNVNEAFKNSSVQISDVLPNLEEINIDYCDLVELPASISNIVSLKKLSITSCHNLSALPEAIGKAVNLETLRLTLCTSLEKLPESITSLHKLNFLDISDCIKLSELPKNVGGLRNLEKINCIGCSSLRELPYSITDLGGLGDVICDKERAALWKPFRTFLSDLRIEVVQVDFNLNRLF